MLVMVSVPIHIINTKLDHELHGIDLNVSSLPST